MGQRTRGVKATIVEYLRTVPDRQATNADIHAAMNRLWGKPLAASTIRSSLQDAALFEQVSRGVHRLRAGV
jgi:hypothetical protein